ncbi:hypothetical protein EsDP_00001062 [Epichloe bromicola]|uniref:Uncharacterized protein n=1 Tax=Epichloe bromicola TaxID=79588 RepID=A0ABQ0CGQ8_9HYPO
MLGLQIAPAEARTGGRSRYSKALPSVPVTNGNNLPPRPVPKDNTSKLQLPPLPHPPALSAQPKGNDDGKSVKSIVRKPVGSSAPNPTTPQPADLTSTHSPLPTTPSPSTGSMAIPRRPVGGSLKLPSQPTLIVPPEPSPTDSICSLLSAYTREPDAPMSGSTDTTANTRNNLPDSVGGNGNQSSQNQPAAARSGSDLLGPKHESRPTPSPFPKGDSDKLYSSQPKPLPLAPSHEQTASPSPRPEIWKRRPQTAEKNKELPELRLNYSHGSTASISSIQTAVIRVSSHTGTGTGTGTESKKGVEESRKASPPRPPVKALPGRNIRPAAKDKPQNTTYSMGGAASRVIHPGGKSATSSKASELKKFPVRVDSKRPPTPEYGTGDADPPPPLSDNVTKPASPVSASGSPKEGMAGTDTPKKQSPRPSLPLKSGSGPKTTPDWTALSPIPEPRLPSATPDLRLATSLQDLRRSGPFPLYEADEADEADEEVSPLTTRPVFSPVDRSRALSTSPESASYRLSPSGPSGLGIVSAPPRYPATASGGSDPRIAYSDTQGPMYRGRDGTLYAETKMTGIPDPKASYFPTRTEKPFAAGTIIASAPLKQSHYNCFQKHKTMNRQSNRNCPLTCQTCGKADAEDRWACTFCHLRVCDNCQRELNGHQRVLQSLVDQLGMSTPPLSLSSTPRPASSLGIESSA